VIEAGLEGWISNSPDPRKAFESWTRAFLWAFDATHPIHPSERAATILRTRFRNPPDLDGLAREVGASKSALTRSFREQYGMSCGEYLTRFRLAWFTTALRGPGSRASQLAEEAGYSRYHNLCDALRRRTGLTPHEIRGLTDDEFLNLQSVNLALHAGENSRRST
jgi:AraC-like DNA-binding protein